MDRLGEFLTGAFAVVLLFHGFAYCCFSLPLFHHEPSRGGASSECSHFCCSSSCWTEEYFTSRAMVDVKELKENNPDFALVLEVNGDGPPHFSDLAYSEVPVHDIEVGSYILVRAGEFLPHEGGTLLGCLNSIRAPNNHHGPGDRICNTC